MTGILFATMEEAEPVLSRGRAMPLSENPFQLYRLENDTLVIISGMGPAKARKAAQTLIEEGVSAILNAGVCGALSDEIGRGEVFSVPRVSDETAHSITLQPPALLPARHLVSVKDPVFQPERRRELSVLGDLVDMEGFAVAEVCAEQNIPCLIIKGVTDFGDRGGRGDIRRYLSPVSGKVADAVFQCLESENAKISRRHCADHSAEANSTDAMAPLWKRLHSFTKIEHTLFSLPLLFAGAWLGAGGRCPPAAALALIALTGLGARIYGMALNRILDRDLDALNPRTRHRELPSGRLTVIQGYSVAAAGIAIYFTGCALLGPTVLKFSLVPLVPLTLYSLLKRFTIFCHFGIGFCLALAPLGAFVAVSGGLAFTKEILLLTLFTFCWMSGGDIIYALMDIESDLQTGIHSIPVAFGASEAQWIAGALHLVAIAALLQLVNGILSAVAAAISIAAFVAAYIQRIPVYVRFFPILAIASIAGAMVVILR